MADSVTNAEVRAALGSINYNGANFQTLTTWLALGLFGSLAIIAATYISIQGSDQTMGAGYLRVLCVIDLIGVGLIALCYIFYLRNIGRYVYGRIRPVGFDEQSRTCFPSTSFVRK